MKTSTVVWIPCWISSPPASTIVWIPFAITGTYPPPYRPLGPEDFKETSPPAAEVAAIMAIVDGKVAGDDR
jgi:hypothetical protein